MPDQIGAQLTQPDLRGRLVFDHLPTELQRAEDATAAADRDRERWSSWWTPAVWAVTTETEVADAIRQATTALKIAGWDGNGRIRPATATERDLLAHLGYQLPSELYTVVIPGPIRSRTWPQLETAN